MLLPLFSPFPRGKSFFALIPWLPLFFQHRLHIIASIEKLSRPRANRKATPSFHISWWPAQDAPPVFAQRRRRRATSCGVDGRYDLIEMSLNVVATEVCPKRGGGGAQINAPGLEQPTCQIRTYFTCIKTGEPDTITCFVYYFYRYTFCCTLHRIYAVSYTPSNKKLDPVYTFTHKGNVS